MKIKEMNPSPVRLVRAAFCLKVLWSNIKSQFMEEIVDIAMPFLLQSCYKTRESLPDNIARISLTKALMAGPR